MIVPLSRGYVTHVDDADWDRLRHFRWHAQVAKGRVYACRTAQTERGPRLVYMHVEILGHRGVDHINGDGLDNRRANLRPATQSQNTQNARKRAHHKGRPTSSRFKGVSFHRVTGKWCAYFCRRGRVVHLGLFPSERQAALAYNAAALAEYGAFARPNVLEGM